MKKFLITLFLLAIITIPLGDCVIYERNVIRDKTIKYLGIIGTAFSFSEYCNSAYGLNIYVPINSDTFVFKGKTFKIKEVTKDKLVLECD